MAVHPETPPAVESPQRTGLALAAILLSVLVVIASVSSLNVALPTLSVDIGATQSDLQWIVDAYALGLAALLLPFGALGDRFGRKRTLLIGLAIMAVGTFLASFANGPGLVIAARAVAAVGAAFVFPATLSTITATFPPERRGKAIAAWASAASGGGFLGVIVSGALIELTDSWRSVFIVIGAAIVVALIGAARFVPDSSDPSHAHLDPIGSVLSILGIGGLVLAIVEGPVKGWTSAISVLGFVAGAVGLVGFVVWELRNRTPMLDVRVLGDRSVGMGALTVGMLFFIMFGFFFTVIQFLSYVRGYGALRSGLALLPLAIGLVPMSQVAIPLSKRFGRSRVGGIGLVMVVVAFFVMSRMTGSSPYLLFAAGLIVLGAGVGMAQTPSTEAILAGLPAEKQGVASALNDVTREVGGALGIALFGSVLNSAYRSSITDGLVGLPPEVAGTVRETPAAASQISAQLGDQGAGLLQAVRESFTSGWETTAFVAMGTAAIAAIVVAVRSPRH